MPTYEFKCSCGVGAEFVLPVAKYRDPQACPSCGEVMARVLSAPIVRGDIQPYQCPVSGKLITSRRAHEENLARTGCRVLEKGERQDVERARKAEDDKLFNGIAETAAKAVAAMPQEKRERLAGELANSGTTYSRL